MDQVTPNFAETADPTEQPDFVTALARGLAVIRAFGAEVPRMTLAEIARRTGFARATVRRSLITLETLGYVESDGRNFALTPRVLALGHSYLSSTPLPRAAQPFLERLTEILQDACSVSILDNDEVLVLARVAPKRLVSLANPVGSRLPAYCTGSGRMLLAGLSDAALDAYLARLVPCRFTARTLVDPSEIRRVVLEAQTLGYGFCDGELENSIRSIAVPLTNVYDRKVAVLGAASYFDRVAPAEIIERFLPHMRRAAEDLRSVLI
jgi:IclR family pca regulon transcriptional regulator